MIQPRIAVLGGGWLVRIIADGCTQGMKVAPDDREDDDREDREPSVGTGW
jgi:hypothetical protein